MTAFSQHICPHCGGDLSEEAPVQYGRIRINRLGDVEVDGVPCGIPRGACREIVYALCRADGRTLSRDALLLRVDSEAMEKVLDVYIHRIREALSAHSLGELIVTDWGRGFHFDTARAVELGAVATHE